MTVGEKIRIARERVGLTQPELAKAVQTTKQAIYKYEKGLVTNIPLSRIEQIAAATGVTAAWLTGWKEKTATANGDGLTKKERAVLDCFRKLDPAVQDFVLRSLESGIPLPAVPGADEEGK